MAEGLYASGTLVLAKEEPLALQASRHLRASGLQHLHKSSASPYMVGHSER